MRMSRPGRGGQAPRFEEVAPLVERRRPRVIGVSALLAEAIAAEKAKGGQRAITNRRGPLAAVEAMFGRHQDVRTIDASEIAAWLTVQRRRGVAPSTAEGRLYALSWALQYAIRTGAADHNPVRDLEDRPGSEPVDPLRAELEVLTAEQYTRMCFDRVIPVLRRVLWTHLVLTGERIGEAEGQQWRDVAADELLVQRQVDTKTGELIEGTKTGRVRHIPRTRLISEHLDRARAAWRSELGRDPREDEPICPYAYYYDETGTEPSGRVVTHWSEGTALRWWHQDLEAVGIPHPASGPRRLHATRHTFITALLDAGADADAVRMITHADPGRGSADAFYHYDHSRWPRAKRAAALFQFDTRTRKACEGKMRAA